MANEKWQNDPITETKLQILYKNINLVLIYCKCAFNIYNILNYF